MAAVSATLAERRVLGPPTGLGYMLAAPTVAIHGTQEQVDRLIPPIIDGSIAWCQLFSEPGAGSDLAGLQTRAVRDGDEWIVSGQKVWTSGGHIADKGMLLARTDADQPKHQGITYFAIDMDQPGIEVRPLREMTGEALFNEVFLDEARVSNDDVTRGPDGSGGRGISTDVLVDLAKHRGVLDDPLVRQAMMRLHTLSEVNRWNMLRAKAGGGRTGGEGNLAKLAMSELVRQSREVGNLVNGADGMLASRVSSSGGVVQEMTLFSPAPSIYGGTDQVQRNIIGERVLGLPKEPGPDKGTPFKDLPQN
jgi:alkylation response protein AidB-like acyl-CoA dehydrogenase